MRRTHVLLFAVAACEAAPTTTDRAVVVVPMVEAQSIEPAPAERAAVPADGAPDGTVREPEATTTPFVDEPAIEPIEPVESTAPTESTPGQESGGMQAEPSAQPAQPRPTVVVPTPNPIGSMSPARGNRISEMHEDRGNRISEMHEDRGDRISEMHEDRGNRIRDMSDDETR